MTANTSGGGVVGTLKMIKIDKNTAIFTIFLGLIVGLIIGMVGIKYIKYMEKVAYQEHIIAVKSAEKEYAECLELADLSYSAELNMSCISRGYEFSRCPTSTVDTYIADGHKGSFISKCERDYMEVVE